MAGLAPGAIVVGLIGVTRALTATEVFGSESGIGTTAIAAALAGAVAGLVSGPILDRWNARWILLATMMLLGISQMVTFALYVMANLTPTTLTLMSIIDGFLVGVQVTALITTQAGLVGRDSRGVAEITNALRIGIGSVIGTFLASSVLAIEASLFFAGVITLAVAGVTIWTSRSFVPANAHSRAKTADVWIIFKGNRSLRSALIINALLALVLPTQLVNLVIVDQDLPQYLGLAVGAGVIGVLAGRLHLSFTGLQGSLTRRVLRSYGIFIVIIAVSWVVLALGSMTLLVVTMAPLIAVGSWTSTLAFGLVTATVQQRLPDRVRGRFTGALACVLSIAAAGGVLGATLVITPQDTSVFLLVLVAALLAVLAVTRGFRGLTTCEESSPA